MNILLFRLFCVAMLSVALLCSSADAQSIPDPRTATPQQAADFLRLGGAVLTTDDKGRIVAFQMPETVGLHDQRWPYLSRLTDLQDLDLGALSASNRQLQYLRPLTKMRNLNLFGSPIDSVALENITAMQELETLYLYRTFIDDEAIPHIAKLKKLNRLNLFDTFMTDKGLDQLAQCKQLRFLTIGNSHAGNFPESQFTDAGVERLRKALPETKIFLWGKTDRHDTPTVVSKPPTSKENTKRIVSLELPKVAPAKNLASRTFGNDWAAFLGPTGDGKSTEKGLLTDWSKRLPKVRWQKSVGTGFAAPSIARGRLLLYHRVRTDDPNARFKERLSCLHAESGEELWNSEFPTQYEDLSGYGDGPRCTPVIDGDRVYLLSPEGMLRCLQLVDGKSIWEVDLAREFELNFIMYGVGSTPVVYRNQLLVAVGGKHDSAGEVGVVAFDKRSGVFRFGVGDDDANYASPRIVQHAGRNWCFAFMRDGLVAFDPDSGNLDAQFTWRSNVAGSVNAATPVVKDNQVFITESYTNGGVMLQFASGSLVPVWQDSRKQRKKSIAAHWATPIEHRGFLYGCTGRHSAHGTLKCIDWATGLPRWEEKTSNRTSMIYADGHFFSLGENGRLRVFRATSSSYQETGRIDKDNAQVMPSYPAWAAPVLSHGLLYIRGKHELICYDLLSD